MKEFFQNKIVMIIESVLLVAGAVGLTLSGVSSEGIQSTAQLAIAGVSAIDAIVTAVYAIVKKNEK